MARVMPTNHSPAVVTRAPRSMSRAVRDIFDGSSMAPCEGRKRRSVVDAATCLTNRVYKAWAEGKIAGALLMDMQGAFDHVSKTQLTK
jgi:hypothetical protein